MLSLFRNTVGHLFSSTTRLSRHIRSVMKRDVFSRLEGLGDEFQRLKDAADRREKDTVISGIEQIEKDIEDLGIKQLLGLEEDAEAMEWRFEKKIFDEHVPKYLEKIKKLIRTAVKDPRKARKLLLDATTAYASLKTTYTRAFAELKKEYSALYEQSREKREHDFINRARGIAVLTRAMRNAYKLRGEYRDVKHDMSAILDAEEKALGLLEDLHKLVDQKASELNDRHMVKKLEVLEEDLDRLKEDVNTLMEHSGRVFSEFTLMQQVFVKYFFMIFQYLDSLHLFLIDLRHRHFPSNDLDEVEKEDAQIHDKLKEMEKFVATAMARMARIAQQRLAELE